MECHKGKMNLITQEMKARMNSENSQFDGSPCLGEGVVVGNMMEEKRRDQTRGVGNDSKLMDLDLILHLLSSDDSYTKEGRHPSPVSPILRAE